MKTLIALVPLAALALAANARPSVGQIPEDSFRQGGGSRIAFTRLRETPAGNFRFDAEIWMMNGDGSDPTRLTFNTTDDLGAEWSPDAKTIAFHGAQWNPDGLTLASPAQLFLLDVESGVQTPLLTDQGQPVLGRFPSWSPNGQKIAFDTREQNIFVINSDGSDLEQLTYPDPNFRGSIRPDWSPDGRKIAFMRGFGGGITQIYVMKADGSDPVPLTDSNDGRNAGPDWSPDGRRIAFTSTRDGNSEVYVMNADGTDPRRLTYYVEGPDGEPDWSPDGRMIAFQRLIQRTIAPRQVQQLFVVSAEGGEQPVQLTDLPSANGHPAWSRGRAVKP
jgi:Tol biopolymer transport system component